MNKRSSLFESPNLRMALPKNINEFKKGLDYLLCLISHF